MESNRTYHPLATSEAEQNNEKEIKGTNEDNRRPVYSETVENIGIHDSEIFKRLIPIVNF